MAAPVKRGRDLDEAVEPAEWPPAAGGYDEALFLAGPVDLVFECAFCHNVLCDPVACPEGHMMCRTCSKQWLAKNKSCPTCDVKLTPATTSVNRAVGLLIGKMKVQCPHNANKVLDEASEEPATTESRYPKRTRGTVSLSSGAGDGAAGAVGAVGEGGGDGDGDDSRCSWTGPVSDVAAHLKSDCGFEPHTCPNTGCPVNNLLRKGAEAHAAGCKWRRYKCPACSGVVRVARRRSHDAGKCPKRRVKCTQMCHATMAADDLDDHIADDCPNTLVPCPMMGNGCDARVPRSVLSEHVLEPAHMPKLMMAMVNTRRELATVCAELASVRKEMATTKTKLRSMMADVASVKGAPRRAGRWQPPPPPRAPGSMFQVLSKGGTSASVRRFSGRD